MQDFSRISYTHDHNTDEESVSLVIKQASDEVAAVSSSIDADLKPVTNLTAAIVAQVAQVAADKVAAAKVTAAKAAAAKVIAAKVAADKLAAEKAAKAVAAKILKIVAKKTAQ